VHDLPICSVDCDAPISSLVTDRCRCARDRCPEQTSSTSQDARGTVGLSNDLSYPYGQQKGKVEDNVEKVDAEHTATTLQQQVDALPWEAVILPGARQTFSLPLSALPKGHVVGLEPEIDTHLLNEACYDLTKAEVPTVGDHLLTKALQERSTPLDDADFAIIPFYQGCYYNYLKENTYKKLADSVASGETQIVLSDRLRASNIVIPFTHDWGSVSYSRPRTVPRSDTLRLYSARAGGHTLRTYCREARRRLCPRPSPGRSTVTSTLAASRPRGMSSCPPSPRMGLLWQPPTAASILSPHRISGSTLLSSQVT